MKIGRAYGFFDCKASKREIEAELPTICNVVKTPSKLELSLIEGVENLKGDNGLISIARDAKDAGIKYVLEGKCANVNNKETADEVASILNQAHQTPLYQNGELFNGAIVYKKNGKYVFRE